MTSPNLAQKLIHSRTRLPFKHLLQKNTQHIPAEGGCGVIGIACSEAIAGKHLLRSLDQMRNRGNGKGGGIAAVGLVAAEFGVPQEVLEQNYLINIAYIDPSVRHEIESTNILPTFEIDHVKEFKHIADNASLGLDVSPPEVVGYFVRVRSQFLESFREAHEMTSVPKRAVEDEIVYQNTFRLNSRFYSSTGKKQAFVLSHGKNQMVIKMVGYGDDVLRYYQLEDLHSHVWIGHHRYPTKGRVWHPGGAHPFVGLNEALVHNGDFANYSSIVDYLYQRNIYPLFLTDTEVSVQVFDLLHRVYGYSLEYVIESLAPTTERDLFKLPQEKQRIYRMLQTTHVHSSPDGPWFFLIAQSAPGGGGCGTFRLIGITDTSMLRPQVFAIQNNEGNGPSIGFAASEKQAVDAALESLSGDDFRFLPRADHYWNARGGSYSDGGAFIFTVTKEDDGHTLVCTDKFGREISLAANRKLDPIGSMQAVNRPSGNRQLPNLAGNERLRWIQEYISSATFEEIKKVLYQLMDEVKTDEQLADAIQILTVLIDRRYPLGDLRRSRLVSLIDESLENLWEKTRQSSSALYRYCEGDISGITPEYPDQTIILSSLGFAIDGEHSLARAIVVLCEAGFKKIIIPNARGHRFIGVGIGPRSNGIRIDIYGSPGDYLGSGVDGLDIHVHGSAQDQLCQMMKSGTLVVHGDVGQTFGYAAKGGEMYILGNAAGRPMINAVGKPKVVINGTCLDYLAESFMAGDPFNGGGFVVLNGLKMSDQGELLDLDEPYPGGNLFSLASGGAIYIRDPYNKVNSDQLNGGKFIPFTDKDWDLMQPYLDKNQRYFGIAIDQLLQGAQPKDVYRKIVPRTVRALQAEEAWVHKKE
jgi:glutamate synthase domain-containing protein 1/glutamate synthase domain-containing protein 3